ncbi:hypothetical protein FLAG1_00087 [Fusarium langsethiae]|uniref:Uncharacterized protein n=1 Tax=Fusarium langsethiae TaxID=179993 RepID=A0A0M9F694_FUSLA|nr:hypothetical protein FLAG1_00087 [Fusarium langsethiae]GKT97912.1 unnamed protein product [Fusarium langsethiae]GKU13433.1 unnamed protein product [Fusarium langsethiae]
MRGIQGIPNELLLQMMEYCGSDLLPFVKAYPAALNCFSENRKCFVARMSDRFRGGPAFHSILRAARLHYITQKPDSRIPKIKADKTKANLMIKVIRNTTSPGLHKFSLSALCIMLELDEDAKRVTSVYSQQALAEMARKPGAEFDIARQAIELTQDEQKRFMTAAFKFEIYCLTECLLEWKFPDGDVFSNSYQNTVGRFYCIMFFVLHEHQELLSRVTEHLESIHDRIPPSITGDRRQFMEKIFLNSMQDDHRSEALNYLYYLASRGLKMLTSLQEMSIEALTKFTVTTFLDINHSYYPAVSGTIEPGDFPLRTQAVERVRLLPRKHLDEFLNSSNAGDASGIWEDTWRRAIPFWDSSEDEVPYGILGTQHTRFWFLYRAN